MSLLPQERNGNVDDSAEILTARDAATQAGAHAHAQAHLHFRLKTSAIPLFQERPPGVFYPVIIDLLCNTAPAATLCLFDPVIPHCGFVSRTPQIS